MKPYKLALLTGTHQHRWAGDHSGLCEKCHKEHQGHQYNSSNPGECRICGATGKCSHPDGFRSKGDEKHACKVCYLEFPHVLETVGTQDACKKCTVCNATFSHEYEDGVCGVCGYACTHTKLDELYRCTETTHRCKICGKDIPHTFEFNKTGIYPPPCGICSVCGYSLKHSGITKLGDACTRDGCNYVHTNHHFHFSSSSVCPTCGYECLHTANNIDSYGYCLDCGSQALKDKGDFWCDGKTPYTGGYEFVKEVITNGYTSSNDTRSDFYRVYKGYRRTSSGSWASNGYYMTCFRITHSITSFGGEYAYRLTGNVFSTAENVNVSPALLTANGVYELKLAQYNLDGTFREGQKTAYTSQDLQKVFVACPVGHTTIAFNIP